MSAATKRKHVTREHACGELRPPDEDEQVVRLLEGRGHNLHLVADPCGEQYLASMPTKFRRSVWAKRGDYLMVRPIKEGNKVRAEITRILDAEHIKYLKGQGFWPQEFTGLDLKDDPFDCGNPNNRGEPEGASHSESSSSENEND